MFELTVNDTGADGNSKLNARDIGNSMDLLRNNIINCPTVLKGMSHEMRTYMNAIVAFSFLMKENSCNDSEREDFSNQILTSCELLIGLFDNFLDAAILDAGSPKSDLKICKIDNILDDVLTEFRETMRKDGHKDLELITEIQYSNPNEVLIDKNKISRVLRSLFQNSIKNTKTGYIKIGCNYSDERANFYILDSGQSYFKCKEFLHTENLNESLSLYNDTYSAINIILAKKLIQMLDGTIWIECNGLTGTGIYFSVPAKKVAGSDVNVNKFVNTMIAI